MSKTQILRNLAFAGLLAAVIIGGCKSPAEKTEDARDNVSDAKENVSDAKQDLAQAVKDSIAFENFKKEAEEKIISNKKQIADLKLKTATAKKELKEEYLKKLQEMELENTALKNRLENYKEKEAKKWEVFKSEFKSDMEGLEKALKNFSIKN